MRACGCVYVHMGVCIVVIFLLAACDREEYPIDVPAVDTHRPKPKVYNMY